MKVTGFKLYSDRNAILCDTKEKAQALCDFLNNRGYEGAAKGVKAWETYKEDTCFYLHGRQLGVISKLLVGATNLIIKPMEEIMVIEEDIINEN